MLDLLVLLILVVLVDGRSAGPRGPLPVQEDSTGYLDGNAGSFDYLMLTLIYPEAVCRADDDTIKDSCEIPAGTPKWTVHGLWPNYANGSYPQFCTRQKFDLDGVKPILENLKMAWPNLYPKRQVYSLWKHEYEKHGTCAQIDPPLSSELKYFQSTLDLLNRFQIEKALDDEGIFPAQEPYTIEAISNALSSGLTEGKRVLFNCLTDKKTKQVLLGDVRICLDLKLNPINCPTKNRLRASNETPHLPEFQPCRGKVVYLPSKNEKIMTVFTNVFYITFPSVTFLGMAAPILFMLVAIAILVRLMLSLCVINMRLFQKVREGQSLPSETPPIPSVIRCKFDSLLEKLGKLIKGLIISSRKSAAFFPFHRLLEKEREISANRAQQCKNF